MELINRSTKAFGPDANEIRLRRFFPSSDQSKPAISILWECDDLRDGPARMLARSSAKMLRVWLTE